MAMTSSYTKNKFHKLFNNKLNLLQSNQNSCEFLHKCSNQYQSFNLLNSIKISKVCKCFDYKEKQQIKCDYCAKNYHTNNQSPSVRLNKIHQQYESWHKIIIFKFYFIIQIIFGDCFKKLKQFQKMSLKQINSFSLIFILGFLSTNLDLVHSQNNENFSKIILNNNKTYDNFRNSHNSFHQGLSEFSEHTVIKPQIHHGKHKNLLKSTKNIEDGYHIPHITLSYYHNGEKIKVDLHLNEDLFPDGHFLRFQDSKNGGDIVKNLTKTDLDLCHYQGTIRNKPKSKVAISTCNGGINGVIFDDNDTYFIYSGPNGRIFDDHYLFQNQHFLQNATCGYNSQSNSINHEHSENNYENRHEADFHYFQSSQFERISRHKRSNSANKLRGPYNANKHSSFVELVIVVDNKVFKSFNENIKKVHQHCQDLANIVNALYVPLNIFVALVGVVVWNEADEIEFSSDGDNTLKNFLHYRRTKLAINHPNDNAQLLTKEQFNGGVVGKALKGPICTYEYSGGVSMEHSQTVGVVATTMAHEMGHNFGMEHDSPECGCPEEKCIMSASSTSVIPRHWSSCSIDQLNVAFSRGMNYCLRNKPTKLFNSPQCGNGFVEPGEQCDCGLPNYCENTCCDPNTCMLRTNASCATGSCCDLTTCRPKTAGTECRSTEGECDLPEFCTGESEYCPTDVFKRDTEVCDDGNAFCFQGTCRSRSNQCKILWGPSGVSSDNCYGKNQDGSRHGNCGFDRVNNKYMQCQKEDVYCGMLHCRHLNERLEFGMESVAVLSHSFMNHDGSIIPCRTAIVDLGLQSIDPGLTPNGAKCGTNKMCVNQKCVNVEDLHANGQGIECIDNCNGHGYCNSKGHCHCFLGFSGPDCNSPGPGGSEDSGPASNPNKLTSFTRFLYIFFLGVVPAVSILFLYIYFRKNRSFISKKPSTIVIKSNGNTNLSRGPSSPSNGGLPSSSPSSTDDMNSALLKSPSDGDTSELNNGMFGKFKGFTLRPLPKAGETNIGASNVAFVHPVTKSSQLETIATTNGAPARMAPAPPVPKHAADVINNLGLNNRVATLQKNKKGSITTGYKGQYVDHNAPALPPPNPGSYSRPIISNPVLEASTYTAKEIIFSDNAITAIPVRPAPTIPPLLSPTPPPVPLHTDPKLNTRTRNGTMKRIASFLKNDDIPKHPQKVKPIIDKEKLKTIEISAPMPMVEQNIDSEPIDEDKNIVKRAQSMRSPTKKQIQLATFGSMRYPSGVVRPKSIVGATRPKSPPPRPPAIPVANKVINTPGYQTPIGSNDNPYDDCEAVDTLETNNSYDNVSPTGSDNIYSVIDEVNPSKTIITPPISDGMSLLGEIVNEIEKINVDSIYSASTLKNKSPESSIANTPTDIIETIDPDYIKSTESSTSSGYHRPSINAPVAIVAPTRSDLLQQPKASINLSNASVSTFKTPLVNKNATNIKTKSPSPSTSIIGKSNVIKKPINHCSEIGKASNNLVAEKKSQVFTNISQKPKTLSKPTSLSASKPSSSDKSVTKKTITNRQNSDNNSLSSNSISSDNFSENQNFSSSNANNKFSNINTRSSSAANNKPSNVASLQKKFEVNNKTTTPTNNAIKKNMKK